MAAHIDRKKVRESFHRQATDYDRHAVVQRRVVDQVIKNLQAEEIHPARLLDVGAGTGKLLGRLRDLYPGAYAVGADLAFGMCHAAAEHAGKKAHFVNSDAENLPFVGGCFDLVLSTSTFQWLTSLGNAFTEVERVLAPGGLFCFALFGEKTLFELRDSYKAVLAGGADRTHSFFSMRDVLEALEGAQFSKATVRSELEVELHHDVPEMLRSLKRIGAGTAAAPVAAKGLSERRTMLDMMGVYRERYRRNGLIPATYEVIYGMGRKAG